jgi:DNA polymerase-3 subunit epsilon
MRDIAAWGDGNFVALDTEATGVDPASEYVVEFSVARLTRSRDGTYGKMVDTRLVNPGVEIPQGAIDVHGITNEKVTAEGGDPAEVLEELLGYITSSVVDGCHPVSRRYSTRWFWTRGSSSSVAASRRLRARGF